MCIRDSLLLCVCAVSYTHLDVYKRQKLERAVQERDPFCSNAGSEVDYRSPATGSI